MISSLTQIWKKFPAAAICAATIAVSCSPVTMAYATDADEPAVSTAELFADTCLAPQGEHAAFDRAVAELESSPIGEDSIRTPNYGDALLYFGAWDVVENDRNYVLSILQRKITEPENETEERFVDGTYTMCNLFINKDVEVPKIRAILTEQFGLELSIEATDDDAIVTTWHQDEAASGSELFIYHEVPHDEIELQLIRMIVLKKPEATELGTN